jgi:hypothetical protein
MSYSGYKSDLTKAWSSGDIISTIKYTSGVQTDGSGNYGRVILGGLLVQFTTGWKAKDSTITLPVPYSEGSGSDSSGWKEPYIVFATGWSSGPYQLCVTSKTKSTFSIGGMGSTNIFFNWITIGPVPTNYNGT